MATVFEAEIHTLLTHERDVKAVANNLVARWNANILTEDERIDCAQFFISSGQIETLLRLLKTAVENESFIPWAQLCEAIGQSKIKINDHEINSLIEGARAQGKASHLVRSHRLDIWTRKIGEIRAQLQTERLNELQVRKAELKGKLQFVRASRLENEEGKVLKELEALFPGEREVSSERDWYEYRRASEIISRASENRDLSSDLDSKVDRLSPEEDKIRTLISSRAQELAKEDPRVAYDLAMNLYFMGFTEDALRVLEPVRGQPSADWFYLELLLESKKFLTALEEATTLENRYAGDPESTFASTYARARALKGLGRLHEAIDLIRGLVNIRPQYKSAHSLLTSWSEGEE